MRRRSGFALWCTIKENYSKTGIKQSPQLSWLECNIAKWRSGFEDRSDFLFFHNTINAQPFFFPSIFNIRIKIPRLI